MYHDEQHSLIWPPKMEQAKDFTSPKSDSYRANLRDAIAAAIRSAIQYKAQGLSEKDSIYKIIGKVQIILRCFDLYEIAKRTRDHDLIKESNDKLNQAAESSPVAYRIACIIQAARLEGNHEVLALDTMVMAIQRGILLNEVMIGRDVLYGTAKVDKSKFPSSQKAKLTGPHRHMYDAIFHLMSDDDVHVLNYLDRELETKLNQLEATRK